MTEFSDFAQRDVFASGMGIELIEAAPGRAVTRVTVGERHLNFNGLDGEDRISYGDVFLQAEQEYSRHNFEHSDTTMLFEQFKMAEGACKKYLDAGWSADKSKHLMALPAYDQCIKASHVFNLLDARGAISVTERAGYIGRIRTLARAVGQAYFESRERLGFPMLKRAEAA